MSKKAAENLVTEIINQELNRARAEKAQAESVLNTTSLEWFWAEEAASKCQSKYEDTLQELNQHRGRLNNLADQCATAINEQADLADALDARIAEVKTLIEGEEVGRKMVSSTGIALRYARAEEQRAKANKAAAEANLVQVRNSWNAPVTCLTQVKISKLRCQRKQEWLLDDHARLEIASDGSRPLVLKHEMKTGQIWHLDEVVQFHSNITIELHEEDDSGGFGGDDDFLGLVVITSEKLDGQENFVLSDARYLISWVEGPGMKACELAVSEAELALQHAEVVREISERNTKAALEKFEYAPKALARIEFELPRARMKAVVRHEKFIEHNAAMQKLAIAIRAGRDNVLKAEAEAAKFERNLNDTKIKAQEAWKQYMFASLKHDEVLAKVDRYTKLLEALEAQRKVEEDVAVTCPLLIENEAATSFPLEHASTSIMCEAESRSRVVEKALLTSVFVFTGSFMVAAVYGAIAKVRSIWPFEGHSMDDFHSDFRCHELDRHSDHGTQTDGGHTPWEFKFDPGVSASTLIVAGQGAMRATVLLPERPVAASPFSSETGRAVGSADAELSYDHSFSSILTEAAVVGDVHVERD